MKQLRKEAAQQPRRIIYNDDGSYGNKPFDTPEKLFALRLRQAVDTQVDTVFYCTGVTGMFTHPTEPGEIVGEFATEGNYPPAIIERDSVRVLAQAGYDVLELMIDFCRQNDLEIFWSLRMNDHHDSVPAFVSGLSRWKREHPDYLLGEREDWNRYDDANPHAWWAQLNYEIPEVRDYIFRILEDVCQRYDVDGIELDWFRAPMFFRPNLDLQPVEPKHLAAMNDFVRRVKAMTERVAQQRGRPLLIACRVPMSVERSRAIGLDVETWLEEDLVDILTLSGGYAPMAMASSVREMAELGHRYGVPVYPCISASGMENEHAAVEAWRGAAMNIWQAGADGVYTFNFFPGAPDERLSQMGGPATLEGLDKIYGVDYIVTDNFMGLFRSALVVPDRLPITLLSGGIVTAKLPVGEDIVANRPEGKTTSARLRLRVSSLVEGDEISITLNGEALGVVTPAEPLTAEPATVWLELEPDPELVQEGDNLVEVELTTQRADVEAVLDRLDLVVRYQ